MTPEKRVEAGASTIGSSKEAIFRAAGELFNTLEFARVTMVDGDASAGPRGDLRQRDQGKPARSVRAPEQEVVDVRG